MPRAHFYRPIQDTQGNIVLDATVRVLQVGTTNPIADVLYIGGTGSSVLANPFLATSGVADFYLDRAQTVRLGITRPGDTERFIEDLDVGDPEAYQETMTFTITGSVSAQIGAVRLYVDADCDVIGVRTSVGVAPVGTDLISDVNKNGSTLFTNQATRPRIVAGQFTGTALPAVTHLAKDDYLTVDVDQVGSATPGTHLVVQVRTQRNV
jgi:hypothetical protein